MKNQVLTPFRPREVFKMKVPKTNGFKILDSHNILRVEGDGAYSTVYLNTGKKELVTQRIGQFEVTLGVLGFVRIHNSHLINLDFLKEYTTRDGGTITLKDGTELLIARRRLSSFKDAVDAYYA